MFLYYVEVEYRKIFISVDHEEGNSVRFHGIGLRGDWVYISDRNVIVRRDGLGKSDYEVKTSVLPSGEKKDDYYHRFLEILDNQGIIKRDKEYWSPINYEVVDDDDTVAVIIKNIGIIFNFDKTGNFLGIGKL